MCPYASPLRTLEGLKWNNFLGIVTVPNKIKNYKNSLSLKSIGAGGADGAAEVLGSFESADKSGAVGVDIGVMPSICALVKAGCVPGCTEITNPELKLTPDASKLSRIGIVPIVIANFGTRKDTYFVTKAHTIGFIA